MLAWLGARARAWAGRTDPWTNVYGLARSSLAVGTLLTLLVNDPVTLFRPGVGAPGAPVCAGLSRISLFCLVSPGHLAYARWCAVAFLSVVASGWRPRVTALLHWWISFSFTAAAILADGGDQVTTVLTMLLLPVALTDSRRWHWHGAAVEPRTSAREIARLLALSSTVAIRVQVAGIYLNSAVAKFAVPEWADGTALYYWFTDPAFGLPTWLRPLLIPVVTTPAGVALLTWGAMALEVFLFAALVMDRRYWKYMLGLGVAFHAAIAVAHGLVSFAFAMWGALILYLRPSGATFGPPHPWTSLADTLRRRVRVGVSVADGLPAQRPTSSTPQRTSAAKA